MKTILVLLVALFLASCETRNPQAIAETSNNEYEVEILFEKDGCKVYQFYDKSNYVYYTDCSGRIGYTEVKIEGKTTTITKVQNQTVTH